MVKLDQQNNNQQGLQISKQKSIASLFKLLASSYFRSAAPFFLYGFTPIMLIITGQAVLAGVGSNEALTATLAYQISATIIISAFSSGFNGLGTVIMEWKMSVLIKRVGATKISPNRFTLSACIFMFSQFIISIIWSLVFAGLIYGWNGKNTLGWNIIFPPNFLLSLVYLLMAFFLGLTFGIALAAVSNRQQTMNIISTVIFIPITLLSGLFIPVSALESSTILKSITYILPTKYVFELFNATWLKDLGVTIPPNSPFQIPTLSNAEIAIDVVVDLVWTAFFVGIIWKFLKWSR